MNKRMFAENILHCSYSMWAATLQGKRHLSLEYAKIAGHVLKTDVAVWMDRDRVEERQEAWNLYIKGA